MNKRDLAGKVLRRLLGTPYKWGGNDPMEGFDCSGLAVEMLKSVGIIDEKSDYTAHGLSKKFKETDILEPGNLVFWDWNNDGRIDHVEIIAFIDEVGEVYTIGASGGSSSTTTPEGASEQDAYVKIKPLRKEYIKVVDPF